MTHTSLLHSDDDRHFNETKDLATIIFQFFPQQNIATVKDPSLFLAAISWQKYLEKYCVRFQLYIGQNRTESGVRRKKQFEKKIASR